MAGERTEAPTPRRREEARRKGQVARSVELTSVAVLFAGISTFQFIGAGLLMQFGKMARGVFLEVATPSARPEELMALAASMIATGVGALAPLVLAVMITGVAMNLVQVGPGFSLTPLAPDFNRVNPITGFQKLFSGRSLVELAKALVKLSVTGFVASLVIREHFSALIALQAASPEGAVATLSGLTVELAEKCGLALLAMALADYVYQRHSHESSLRMSREDLREEHRHSEGDPHLKSKLRQMARQLASRRMMHSVPGADVVVTNPTHYAVALRYDPSRMGAPIVTAKGQQLVAEQIKRVAREHRVPIVENPPLARALFASVEIGGAIPAALYQAVAEVLAFIYRLRDEASRTSRPAGAANGA